MNLMLPEEINVGTQRVVVYRNLNAAKRGLAVWSVAFATSTDRCGKLIGHVDHIALDEVHAVVTPRAQHIARHGLNREVCAWLAGIICHDCSHTVVDPRRVTFDIRDDARFRARGVPFDYAAHAIFNHEGCYVSRPERREVLV